MFQAKFPFVLFIHILVSGGLYQTTPKWPQIWVATVKQFSLKKIPKSLLSLSPHFSVIQLREKIIISEPLDKKKLRFHIN